MFVQFLTRRILYGILVLWLISMAVFGLFYAGPHNPAQLLAGPRASAQTIALIQRQLGLDKPLVVQYGEFLWRLLHGNLGYSYYSDQPVTSVLAEGLPITASLVVGGAALWLAGGIFVGVLSATRARSLLDRLSTTFVLFGLSMPTFLIGLVLLYFLYFRLRTAFGIEFFPPPSGYTGLTEDPSAWFRRMLLPWVTLAFVQSAIYTRLTRGSLLDVLGEDYIRTARAKGLSERRVVYRHGLRAALTPVLTQFGIDIGTLLGGVVVTETVFNLQGLGKRALMSITTQDLPVIIGIVLVTATLIVIANIVVDIMYAVLDPRVRLV